MRVEDTSESELPVLNVQVMGAESRIGLVAFRNNVQASSTMVSSQLHAQQEIYNSRIAELEERLVVIETMDASTTEADKEVILKTKDNIPGPKSVKLPDPPKLTDGTDPKMRNWRYLMEQKFAANADYFDTPTCRLAYLISRTAGEAQDQLLTRLQSKILSPITEVNEALDYLELLYHVPELRTVDPWDLRPPDEKRGPFWYCFRVFMYNVVKYEIPEVEWRKKLCEYLGWKYDTDDMEDFFGFEGSPKALAKQVYLRWARDKWEDEYSFDALDRV